MGDHKGGNSSTILLHKLGLKRSYLCPNLLSDGRQKDGGIARIEFAAIGSLLILHVHGNTTQDGFLQVTPGNAGILNIAVLNKDNARKVGRIASLVEGEGEGLNALLLNPLLEITLRDGFGNIGHNQRSLDDKILNSK